MKPLTPPDFLRCQAEITRYVPFVMGGSTKQTERCSNKPTVVIHDAQPGEDGRVGSMSLCYSCLLVARKQLGQAITEYPIPS